MHCAAQLSFMAAVVVPSFTSLAALTPTTSRAALDNVALAQVRPSRDASTAPQPPPPRGPPRGSTT